MRDWKGNIVKAGDVIIPVSVFPIFGKTSLNFFSKEKGLIKVWESQQPPAQHWRPGKEIDIKEHSDGSLYFEETSDGINYKIGLSPMFFTNSIICIKGVSDRREEWEYKYYSEKYFKQLNPEE